MFATGGTCEPQICQPLPCRAQPARSPGSGRLPRRSPRCDGGAAWTATLISTMARLGVEEKATRQALMRTAADGWLTAERRGRRTRWLLTGNAEELLTEGTERIYGFGAHRDGWDGSWLLVLARAPESERAARHVLRSRLTWAGLGSPAPGVWISTN